MAAPTPDAVRRAIVNAITKRGMTYEETAALLGVGRATVSRVLGKKRRTGKVAPAPPGGGWKSPLHGRVAQLLKAIVTEMPDATVAELTAVLVTRGGVKTSRAAVLRALHRLGFSRKKSPSPRWSATRPSDVDSAASSARSSRR